MINGAMKQAMYPTHEAQLAAHEAHISGLEKELEDLRDSIKGVVSKIDRLTLLVIVGLAEVAFGLAQTVLHGGK